MAINPRPVIQVVFYMSLLVTAVAAFYLFAALSSGKTNLPMYIAFALGSALFTAFVAGVSAMARDLEIQNEQIKALLGDTAKLSRGQEATAPRDLAEELREPRVEEARKDRVS